MEAGTRGPEEIKRKEVELGSHSWMDRLVADRALRKEVELGSHSWMDCLVADRALRKEAELGSHSSMDCLAACRQSPGEIKRREVELDSHSWTLIAGWTLLLLSCSSTAAFRIVSV